MTCVAGAPREWRPCPARSSRSTSARSAHNAGAARADARRTPAELWAVVKADGYGHGAVDAGRAALEGGATALCVATVGEALALRAALRDARILVLGPTRAEEVAEAREARARVDRRPTSVIPDGVPVHLKLDTGMGRWGLAELPAPGRGVVGPDDPPRDGRHRPVVRARQLERFLDATEPYAGRVHAPCREQRRGADPACDPARCRALRHRPLRHRPARSRTPAGSASARRSLGVGARAGSAARTGRVDRVRTAVRRGRGDMDRDRPGRVRRRVPARPHGDGGARRRRPAPRSSGTVSMDALAVRLPGPAEAGAPVTLVGDGITLEAARARRGDDRLRARVRDQDESRASSDGEVVGD